MDSGASLHMTSKNELTSGEKDTIIKSKLPTHERPRQGRVDGRIDSVRQRLDRLCHNDAVGKHTGRIIFGLTMRRNGLLL